MKCQELVNKLKDNGIDFHEERFVLGVDCYDCGDRFEKNDLGYVHIIKGDRDNGRIAEIYKGEDEYVVGMLKRMQFAYESGSQKYTIIKELLKKAKKDLNDE